MTDVPAPDQQPVVLTTDEGVATVRFNRPGAMNALDRATKEALLAALRTAAADEAVRCVVLTGTGRAFCVGQDLKEHVALLEEDPQFLWTTVRDHYNPVAQLLATMDKPVVASLNGIAAGAGVAFALAADLRIMSEDAGMNTAFAGIALSCDSGSSWHLPRLVGPARAKELLLRPRTVPARECLDLGLVTEVVPADQLEHRVAEVAGQLAAGPTKAYGAIRRAVAYSLGQPLPEALAHEAGLMRDTGASEDHGIAVAAFLAKEQPVYRGR